MADFSWPRSTTPASQSLGAETPSVVPETPFQQWPSDFIPCASTASMFLYAQGSVILCLHHDTLAVAIRFTLHQEKVVFIAVDNVSERGPGRLVISYDVSQTAIVWDLFTGAEISRFASFEPFRVAAWMRNGNVVFGNGKGEVIYYEPSTSEHGSTRTIFDPITSLAPAQDCQTYAIGYQNGSILIARLQPSFTVLHTLTTSKGPSPIVSLAWHASSSKQKSDMLATQTGDGDLRVWSIARPPESESPRAIRILKRSETHLRGPKWIAWSKNGRIVQYAERETWLWDVRTRHVTYVTVPTIEDVLGIANHGPTATLFTLGPNYTVQQYDLENPAMVANVQHLPSNPGAADGSQLRSASPSYLHRSNGFQDVRTQDFAYNDGISKARVGMSSPVSVRSRTDSLSSRASSGRVRQPWPPAKSNYSETTFSLSSPINRLAQRPGTSVSNRSYTSTSSVRSRGGSRLKNEVTLSPVEEKPLEDLFPYIRARVNQVPFNFTQHRPRLNSENLTPDDLRRQMLEIVFGWQGDIEDLLRDELNRHPAGSQNAILLSRWLGEHKPEQLLTMLGSGSANKSAWMFLALSQMGGEEQANKIGQTFVQRLLESGDIHASATILLALGDRNDAIEVYVSRNYYMEAILMTCLLMPQDWQRQSYLVRQWGEYVVSNSQQQLAIRCFMCTGVEPSVPWMSPTALVPPAAPFENPQVQSPASEFPQKQAESPKPKPPVQRMTVKNSALKLITSFGPSTTSPSFRFPGLKSDDGTPTNAPGVTPIAESAADFAMSPGAMAWHRPDSTRSYGSTLSAKTVGSAGYNRGRLPSIGETPVDVQPPSLSFPKPLPTPDDSEKGKSTEEPKQGEGDADGNQIEAPLVLLTSDRYEPGKIGKTDSSPQTAVQARPGEDSNGLPSPSQHIFDHLKSSGMARNGSRDRKPEGLQLRWPLPSDTTESDTSAYRSCTEQTDGAAETSYPSPAYQSLKSSGSASVTGRSTDQYISSLDEAKYYAKHYRRVVEKQRSRHGSIESRGRSTNRYIQPAKRSPSSPVPMSPEELARYNVSTEGNGKSSGTASRRSRSRAKSRARSTSSRGVDRKQKASSRATSRTGRGKDRDSGNRSPTSPHPLSSKEELRGFEESLRFVTMDRERRYRQRSSSRRRDRGISSNRDPVQRDPTPDQRRPRARSSSGQAREGHAPQPPPVADSSEEQPKATTTTENSLSPAERLKRELAAAELEARRLSLARRPSAPNIPLPGTLQSSSNTASTVAPQASPQSEGSLGWQLLSKNNASARYESMNSSDSSSSSGRSSIRAGLPATPRAMRPVKNTDGYVDDNVPPELDPQYTLPSTTYQADARHIPRSMSVPAVDYQPGVPNDLPHHLMYIPNLPRSRSTSRTRLPHGHRRDGSRDLNFAIHGSPPGVSVSVELENSPESRTTAPPILPELQHLTGPPPPPPVSQLEAKRDEPMPDNARFGDEMRRPVTAEPESRPAREFRRYSVDHRRERSFNETISTKLRNFTERMRSSSRGPRVQFPSQEGLDRPSPYESIQFPVNLNAGN